MGVQKYYSALYSIHVIRTVNFFIFRKFFLRHYSSIKMLDFFTFFYYLFPTLDNKYID